MITAQAIAALRSSSRKQTPRVDAALASAAKAQFPITARDLMPAFQGAALGEALRRAEKRWIASGFTLCAEELLADEKLTLKDA